MPRHTIQKVLDAERQRRSGRQRTPSRAGERDRRRARPAYIMTDILAGNTIRSVNPFWGKWRITDGVTGIEGPARRVQDRHDQRQQGRPRVRLPRAADEQEPAGPRRRRLDGQLRQHAQRRQALAGHVGAAVVGDPVGRVEGHADRGLRAHQAQGPRHRDGRRVHRHEARAARPGGPSTSCSSPAPSRRRAADVGVARRRRRGLAASGGARAASGPMVTRTFIDFSNVEAGFRSLAARRRRVAGARGPRRRRRRAGRRAPTRPTSTAAASTRSAPRGAARFAPTKTCQLAPPPPTPCVSIDPFNPCPSAPPEASPPPGPGNEGPGNGNGNGGNGDGGGAGTTA